MIEKITKRIVASIVNDNDFNEEQIEEMEYTLKIFLYEIIKVVLLILFFSYLGYYREASIIIMVGTKPFIGGYHESSQIRCFCATVIITFAIILLAKANNLNISSILVLGLLNIFCIYNKAPIINEKMPITKEIIIKRNRRIGTVNTIILIFFSIFLVESMYSSIIIWTITIQTMFMFNKKIKR